MAVSLSDNTVSTLASGQNQPTGLAIDGTYVYWTNYGSGTVMKVPATTFFLPHRHLGTNSARCCFSCRRSCVKTRRGSLISSRSCRRRCRLRSSFVTRRGSTRKSSHCSPAATRRSAAATPSRASVRRRSLPPQPSVTCVCVPRVTTRRICAPGRGASSPSVGRTRTFTSSTKCSVPTTPSSSRRLPPVRPSRHWRAWSRHP